jgi:hypothetical protein
MHTDRVQDVLDYLDRITEAMERSAEAAERQAVATERLAAALEPDPEHCLNLHGMLSRIGSKL